MLTLILFPERNQLTAAAIVYLSALNRENSDSADELIKLLEQTLNGEIALHDIKPNGAYSIINYILCHWQPVIVIKSKSDDPQIRYEYYKFVLKECLRNYLNIKDES